MAARSRSCLVPSLVAILGLGLTLQSLNVFIPAPVQRNTAVSTLGTSSSAAYAAAVTAAALAPQPALAFGEDEDDGFDVRYLVVLALPLAAATWALFNVWRVAFRQVSRFSTSNMGSEQGVAPGD
mmetsp:Transcript_19721/g.35722  ORF Transcript_19721/g.35722 Transcript_19721/m.35722 type:complete len:125 (+) Transcript_19721:60-434(+)